MDPHPIEQNIQALNDGEHNLKLHAPCSIIGLRSLPGALYWYGHPGLILGRFHWL